MMKVKLGLFIGLLIKPLILRDEIMKKIILITGTSSGFGKMAAEILAQAGHLVYGSMRDIKGRNKANKAASDQYSVDNKVFLNTLELDVCDQTSIDAAVTQIIEQQGKIDVIIHNAGHLMVGPTEAFSPEEILHLYDVNVAGTQRVNRAVLPHMREAGEGLVVWIGSSSTSGGTPPYLAPYFAAKAGMDALAVSYSAELSRWGIETSIIVPGAFTKGTNHFQNAGHPKDEACVEAYAKGPTSNILEIAIPALAALEPADADPQEVASAILDVVNIDHGKRPFRVHIDPIGDGAEEVDKIKDRIQAEMLRRIGLEDLLKPAIK